MKHFNFLFILFLFIGFSKVKSQENAFLGTDNPAKCENIKEGKFLRVGYPVTEWVMTVKDNIQTEYYNDGKDYVKSRLEFVDDCHYKVIITAKSDENYPVKLGETVLNEITETDRNFIKLKSEYNNKTFDVILNKIEGNN
ncbi:hypothetical protein M2347_003672 [Chryseobacterium sp. H1D6B]|uniref:hypothetical protein n=1 Tax=Chryseobacterium sp. H1D6B TaxID=2940588 RepID=UPI0015CCD87E|nr:hypothetical protein [Chryseobacterium sp. H1D6B]MDH6253945.1 hypothetical protein [Chryseobacterium sp. H1D6B]